jgi:hypothetical protein
MYLTYSLALTVTALSLEAVLADIKEAIRNTRKVVMEFVRRYHIKSHLFICLYREWKRAQDHWATTTRHYCIWELDRYRPGLCVVRGANRQCTRS